MAIEEYIEASEVENFVPRITHYDTPLDSGFGLMGEIATGEVIKLITNPYAGTEAPSSVFRRKPEVDNGFWQTKPA